MNVHRKVVFEPSILIFLFVFFFTADSVGLNHKDYIWKPVPIYSQEYEPLYIKEGMQMTHALSYAPSDPSITYLCTDTSRVWVSVDDGKDWQQSSTGITSNGCRSLLVDPVNSKRVIVAAFLGVDKKKGQKRKWKQQGLYLTEDGGSTWKLVNKTNFFRQISKSPIIAYDSSSVKDDRTMVWYAGSYDAGLLKSTDAGYTWTKVAPELLTICDIKEDPNKPGELLIATENSLYRHSKEGVEKIGAGLPHGTCAIVMHPSDSEIVIAAAKEDGIYRSTDGGKTFKVSSSGLPLWKSYIASLAISSKAPYVIYAKAHSSFHRLPFFSEDAGLSWRQGRYGNTVKASSFKHHFWFSSALSPHPENALQCLIVSSGDGKVFMTSDGGVTWNLYGRGYTGARVMDMSFDKDDILLALTDFGIWSKDRSSDFFKKTVLPRYKGAQSTHLIGRVGNNIIASVGTWSDQSVVIKTADAGWRFVPEIHGHLGNLLVHPEETGVAYIDNYRTLNFGKNWRKLSRSTVAISKNPPGRLFTLESGKKKNTTTVFLSDDNGDTWKQYTPSLPVKKTRINRLVADPFDKSRLYLATYDGVWIFNGIKWIKRSEASGLLKDRFGLVYISELIADSSHSGRLIAGRAAPGRGTSNGVFQSEDGGMTWENISGSLGDDLTIWSLHLDTYEAVVYAVTDAGLFKLLLNNNKIK